MSASPADTSPPRAGGLVGLDEVLTPGHARRWIGGPAFLLLTIAGRIPSNHVRCFCVSDHTPMI